MNNKNFQICFDCSFSKVRAGAFNVNKINEAFYAESKFFRDHLNLEPEIQKIITSFEKDTNEYIDNINLMIDSPKMLSIAMSISKKLDGSKLRQTNIQFLIQEAKQQILKYYTKYNIAHIIINNYKIDDVDYSYLPDEIECHFISLDIIFICLPSDLVLYFKKIFSNSNISVNQIICSSYAKSINYKDNLNLNGHLSFIDIGFNKTSVISYFNNKILSLDVLPVGGNYITKDISKVLNIDLEKSEQIKLNFDKNYRDLNDKDLPIETLQKIIFYRIDEILELCLKSLELNLFVPERFKILLMGNGSKILGNHPKDNIFFSNDIDYLADTLEDICQSGFKFGTQPNNQEVMVVPKKHIKHDFFERFFHFFK